ncbi:hypothetical protein ACOMHN_045319 [Nucella lapillus]
MTFDSVTLQSLLTLVQHQMTTLEQQAATIQSLQRQVISMQSSSFQQSQSLLTLKATVNDVRRNVGDRLQSFNAELRARANVDKVAFTAHMSQIHVNVGDSGPFIFDTSITNIGDAYNNHSGIFVAPRAGVYVFAFIMVNDGDSGTIHAQIQKNRQILGVGTSDRIPGYNAYDDGSVFVTTRLVKGDHVYVKRRDGGTRVYGDVYTNFSGFLLSADV